MSTTNTIPRQGTDGWQRARGGKVTGSRFGDLSESKSGGWGVGAMSYCYEIVGERLRLDDPDWKPPPELKTAPIEWGNTWEQNARAAYVFDSTEDVVEYGFLTHRSLKGVGVSLDGVAVNSRGIIEIKCPYTTREHVRTMHTGEVPAKYKAQVQGNLWVSEREWCDFISFDPRIAEQLMLCVVRVERDEKYIEKLAAKVGNFVELVNRIESEVRDGKQAA